MPQIKIMVDIVVSHMSRNGCMSVSNYQCSHSDFISRKEIHALLKSHVFHCLTAASLIPLKPYVGIYVYLYQYYCTMTIFTNTFTLLYLPAPIQNGLSWIHCTKICYWHNIWHCGPCCHVCHLQRAQEGL